MNERKPWTQPTLTRLLGTEDAQAGKFGGTGDDLLPQALMGTLS